MALPNTIPDLVCVDDMDLLGAETTADLEALAQDILHLLEEDLGSNLDDPTRGLGAYNLLGGPVADLIAWPASIRAQVEQDTRVDSCTASAYQDDTGAWRIQIKIVVGGRVWPLNYTFSPGDRVIFDGW